VKFHETDIPGVFLIEPEPHFDERGFFSRVFCPKEYAAAEIAFTPVQVNLSRSLRRYTLRGLHYQDAPHAEGKVVQVTSGAVYDVVVDLRRDSAAFGRWLAFELDAYKAKTLYIPEGCAHGFLTLQPDTDVLYYINRLYVPGHAKGYRWNDPVLNITWPAQPECVAKADEEWPDFSHVASAATGCAGD
jgi:dTDP-4-dehydrorhamnose 3,5-epimerase